LLLRDETGVTRWIWPTNLSGAGDWDVMLFHDGSLGIDLARLH